MNKPRLDAHIRGNLSEALGLAVEGPCPDYDHGPACIKRHREKYAQIAVEIVIDALFTTVGDIVTDKLDTLDCDTETRDMIENHVRIHAFDLMCRQDQ